MTHYYRRFCRMPRTSRMCHVFALLLSIMVMLGMVHSAHSLTLTHLITLDDVRGFFDDATSASKSSTPTHLYEACSIECESFEKEHKDKEADELLRLLVWGIALSLLCLVVRVFVHPTQRTESLRRHAWFELHSCCAPPAARA